MKTITVEDIYIELESIFDENESGYNRRLLAYKKLNELLPKWEGSERQENTETLKNHDTKALHIADVSVSLFANFLRYVIDETTRIGGDYDGNAGMSYIDDTYEKIAEDYISISNER